MEAPVWQGEHVSALMPGLGNVVQTVRRGSEGERVQG